MSNLMHFECCLCTIGTRNQNGLLRCKCDPNQLQYGERCGKVLPFKHQVGRILDSNDNCTKHISRPRLCKLVVFQIDIKYFPGLAGLHGSIGRFPGEAVSDWGQESSGRAVTPGLILEIGTILISGWDSSGWAKSLRLKNVWRWVLIKKCHRRKCKRFMKMIWSQLCQIVDLW